MGESDYFAQFEDMGISKVRDFAPQWQGYMQTCAYNWLKLKDDEARNRNEQSQRKEAESRRLSEASQSEQLRIAREASDRAKIAAIAAIVAIPIAIIAIVISVLAWLYPRH